MDITLPGNYVISQDHGATLKFLSLTFDAKAQEVSVVYEMHDGANWLGPQVTLRIDVNGTRIVKLDGTAKAFANITFTHAAVQALVDVTKVDSFLSNQGGDLRTEP